MDWLPLRLHPGSDLRRAIEAAVAAQGLQAAFVVCGIGSLRPAVLRLAGAQDSLRLDADVEILTLSGSVAGEGGSHLHLSVSDASGRVLGGHAGLGCTVRTTVELLLAPLPDWRFTRELDAATGYAELKAQIKVEAPAAAGQRP
jgi:predicted DNA-binding protein with PD1-like motif